MFIFLFLLLGLGAIFAASLIDAESGETGEFGDDDENLIIDESDRAYMTGTGDDTVTVDPNLGHLHNVNLTTGAGADDVDLTQGNDTSNVYAGTFDLGAGDDSLTANDLFDGQVIGGDGNDVIHVGGMNSGGSVSGGAGDDVITGEMGQLHGDDGNDTVTLTASSVEGTGHWGTAYGDAGDDTLRYTGNLSEVDGAGIYSAPDLHGGEGTDSFEVVLEVGTPDAETFEDPDLEKVAYTFDTVVLADFEADTESLEVDVSAYLDAGYDFASAGFETDEDGNTHLAMNFDHDTEDSHTVRVDFGAADVTEANVSFTGGDPDVFAEQTDVNQTAVIVRDDQSVVTGEGDDVVTVDGESVTQGYAGSDTVTGVSIRTGGGEDTVDFTTPDTLTTVGAFVDLGAGDDVLTGDNVYGSDIVLGEGNDTVEINSMIEGSVDGGAGNDVIRASSLASSEFPTLYGGEGDDYIEGAYTAMLGEEGNDTLVVTQGNNYGTGYSTTVNGGAGDDIIRYVAPAGNVADESSEWFVPGGQYAPTVRGGDGADRFELGMDDAVPFVADDETQGDPSNWLTVADFEPGVDTLAIDGTPPSADYVFASATIETDANGESTVRMSYTSATFEDREIYVDVGSAAITWDDVEFVNTQPLSQAVVTV